MATTPLDGAAAVNIYSTCCVNVIPLVGVAVVEVDCLVVQHGGPCNGVLRQWDPRLVLLTGLGVGHEDELVGPACDEGVMRHDKCMHGRGR